MEYFGCSASLPSFLQEEFEDQEFGSQPQRSTSTPTLAESSISEISSSEEQLPAPHPPPYKVQFPKPGDTSPSTVESRRRLSTALVTDHNCKHPALKGRKTVILPELPIASFTQPMGILPRVTSAGCSVTRTEKGKKGSKGATVTPLLDDRKSRCSLHRAASEPIKDDKTGKFRSQPTSLRLDAWSDSAAENFQVRGPNYLVDRIKQPSQESAFRLLTVDLVNCDQPILSAMCAHPTERVQQALKRERETGVAELPPFVFAVNLCIPGVQMYHMVSYFAVDNMEEIQQQATPFGRLMHKFIFGDDDDFRDNTFKLIPRVVDGNFVVRKAVGSKPTILGKKIKQLYFRGERYFEMVVDISSEAVAQRIVKLALGYAKSLVVDMMFLLEGTSKDTLPERIFAGYRIKNVDFKDKDGKRTVSSKSTKPGKDTS